MILPSNDVLIMQSLGDTAVSIWLYVFAFRTKDPEVMKAAPDPVGPENNASLMELARKAGIVIAAWGNDGAFLGRSLVVRTMIPNLSCLNLNKTGEPAHPLYQRKSILPTRFN